MRKSANHSDLRKTDCTCKQVPNYFTKTTEIANLLVLLFRTDKKHPKCRSERVRP